ncbi:Vacuolar membrane-associated protein iml1 [Penicillium subrubescens]|uniref:Vacuolar membrane-associated protein IML1 n=1 Tax=Penicillium subrubescens TaxID=1316194 RepID=A0A1Q5UH82_9EURO|nr:Vacuolar membrane-associated protein iml1 [Penicillium subrubescens]KAJ5880419.1 Vacuolar membrane-associated protein iml1 [Penicillium subrubescens]OKP11840.1 Vacuolar membrane-associated protein iml1 [Penicillium subrubescens]
MSLRGPMRRSHLRQVSAASLETLSTAHSMEASHRDHGPTPDERIVRMSTSLARRQCTLWVHDEMFSREELLLNPSALGESGVQVGDIVEILPVRASGDPIHSSLKPDAAVKTARDTHSDLKPAAKNDSTSKFKTPLQSRCLFVVKPLPQDIKTRHPKLEISVTSSVANIFGFKNRTQVHLSIVDRKSCAASHVDIAFRDQYIVRSDMWRLVESELVDKIVYKGQKIMFMGSIKATIKNIFIREKKVLSGYFAPNTIPVFRSESAKYVLFIQMSREMWDFDSEGSGDILFSRVINGFLPELFKRWANSDAKHLVTIVLFTRVEYDASAHPGLSKLNSGNLKNTSGPNQVPTRDFYRVVVNDMASGHWTTILDELKKNFRTFLRDVSILKTDDLEVAAGSGIKFSAKPSTATIAGRPSTALRGNILEAIHLASAHLAYDHIDRDMVHTGTSIIVITPGSGVFEVSYDSLASTTEALANRGIAIDLVCLSPMPLHSVPLFKYREPVERHSSSLPSTSEIPRNNMSPEIHHSISSLVSRSSYLSPGSYLSASRMRERGNLRSKDWSYGIPHWLDISYWNPETYREARRILKNDPNAPIPFTVTRPAKAFTPRVRMYEIQMMGVMESEQSNISIPYLLEGLDMPRRRGSWVGTNPARAPPRARFANSSSLKAQYSDSLRPETSSFLENVTDPSELQIKGLQKSRKSVMAWMDQYDENVFSATPKRRQPQRPKSKRLSEPEVQVAGIHERISARSISRLREHESNANEKDQIIRASGPRRLDASSVTTPKSPVSTKSPSPTKPALKTPTATRPASRISRTISFALRGLIATPPRAQASTGVHVEHANAGPMSNQRGPSSTFSDTRSITSLSPSETASIPTIVDVSSRPSTPPKLHQEPRPTPSKPISIKPPAKKPSEVTEQSDRGETQGSLSRSAAEVQFNDDVREEGPIRSHDHRIEITVNHSSRDGSIRASPSKALSPWVRSVNPCNTPKDVLRDTSWFGRWQHAYPRPPHVAVVKWKSLKSPAVLPLTTEEFPTATELASDYLQTPYRVFPNDDADVFESPKTRGVLLREMIALRLSHGFQIIVGKNVAEVSARPALEFLNVFDTRGLERDGETVFLSKGNAIHRLICIDGGEIEVTRFTHQATASLAFPKRANFTLYQPAMRTILRPEYEIKDIKLDPTAEEYNWNYADNYVAGHRDYLHNPAQQLHFWRVRYVLIPMHLHTNSRRHLQSFNDDNEEEIHLLGISHLTHIWQRHKYVSAEEKRFEISTKKRDANPLNIMYQTRNPSEVVAAELDRLLLTDPGLDNPPAQLLPESELLERSSINLSSFAQIIQGDKGVRMMDRRWHWRLHYNCFIGFEFTTWLLQNFRDIDTREEAVGFGNELMKHGLFQHVEKRHNFRDGNYFYQISAEYRVTRPESRGGWFPQLRADKSMPSTPAIGNVIDSPSSFHTRSDSTDDKVPPTPNTPSKFKNKVAIMLSKSLKYDVDSRKRSNRPEVIDLHYDRLHNPENCFHIELSWMNTTPKLIEDTVHSWASTAEKFGLKLVQVPIAEGCAIDRTQPFRKPYEIRLKVPPPKGPVHTVFNNASFAQPGPPDNLYYQKALLRKFDFVLDFEACTAFPADVEVSYSWGKLDYKYPQFIHRNGSIIVQITDEGHFLLLANRLVSTRSAASRDAGRYEHHNRADYRGRTATHDPLDRISPRLSPLTRPLHEIGSPLPQPGSKDIDSANLYRAPEIILNALEEFCKDAAQLQQFYSESHVRPVSTKVEPTTAHLMDTSIPSLELPASVVSHHISPPPGLPSRVTRESRDNRDGLKSPEMTRARARGESLSLMGSPRSGSLRPLI